MGNARHVHGPVTTAKDGRFADGGLIAVQGPTAIDTRTGVLVGPGSTALVTGTSATAPMTVAVAPHHWVTSRGAANGPYLGALEAATTVTIPAAPAAGAGTRIDVVYSKQQDAQLGIPSPDGTTAPLYGVVSGVAGGAKPALPVGAEELATVAVSPGATATNGANIVITNTARQTVARGARIHCRNQSEQDALTAFPGLEVYRLDTGHVLLCTAAGPPATWVRTNYPYPLGDIAYKDNSASVANAATAEAILAGSHNITGVTLATGRSYRVVAAGRSNIAGSGGLVEYHVRGANGAAPTLTSPIASTAQVYCVAAGGGGQTDFSTSGQPFQVASAGVWQFSLTGAVTAGGTAMNILPDDRGVHSMTVTDCGPAPTGLRTI